MKIFSSKGDADITIKKLPTFRKEDQNTSIISSVLRNSPDIYLVGRISKQLTPVKESSIMRDSHRSTIGPIKKSQTTERLSSMSTKPLVNKMIMVEGLDLFRQKKFDDYSRNSYLATGLKKTFDILNERK